MIAIIASCVLAISSAPANLLPNASFDRAVGEKPVAWSLAGGAGAYDAALGRGGTGCLTVSRGRSDASYWTCPVRGLKPGGLYAFSFHGRMVKPGSDGCVVSGPLGMNRDFQVGAEWTPCRFIFPVSPSHDGAITVRLGTWQKRATVAFDDAELLAASAFHRRCGKFVLGQGEQLKGNAYSFRAPLSSLLSAYSRPLCDFHCGFNSHRWTFGDGDWVVYRHEVGGEALRSATVEVQVGYYTGGTLELQARRSGADTWSTFAVFEGLVTKSVPLPGDLFPAESLDVRLLHKRAGKGGPAGLLLWLRGRARPRYGALEGRGDERAGCGARNT